MRAWRLSLALVAIAVLGAASAVDETPKDATVSDSHVVNDVANQDFLDVDNDKYLEIADDDDEELYLEDQNKQNQVTEEKGNELDDDFVDLADDDDVAFAEYDDDEDDDDDQGEDEEDEEEEGEDEEDEEEEGDDEEAEDEEDFLGENNEMEPENFVEGAEADSVGTAKDEDFMGIWDETLDTLGGRDDDKDVEVKKVNRLGTLTFFLIILVGAVLVLVLCGALTHRVIKRQTRIKVSMQRHVTYRKGYHPIPTSDQGKTSNDNSDDTMSKIVGALGLGNLWNSSPTSLPDAMQGAFTHTQMTVGHPSNGIQQSTMFTTGTNQAPSMGVTIPTLGTSLPPSFAAAPQGLGNELTSVHIVNQPPQQPAQVTSIHMPVDPRVATMVFAPSSWGQ